MGTNTPYTCIPGLVWQKQARRFSQFELKVGELGFPIHIVCVSAALYHRGHAAAIFPLRWIRSIGNDQAKRSLKTRRSLVRSACKGKLSNQKSVFRCNWTHVVAFCRLNRRFWADLRCPQFAFLRWSHFQERTPYIWIRELKGLKLCVRNFQVVAFVRWSQGQVWLYYVQLHCRAQGWREAQLQRAKTTTFSSEQRSFQSVNSIKCLSAVCMRKMATLR